MSQPHQSGYQPQGMPPYPGPSGYAQPRSFRSVPTNWGWAVAACIFFWPIGFSAVSAAGRVLPALLDGDVNAAMADSAKARRLGIIALCVLIGLFLLYLALLVVLFSIAANSCSGAAC